MAYENVLVGAYTAVTFIVALVALSSWWHARSAKVLLLTIGFTLFFVKGAFLTAGLFLWPRWETESLVPALFIDLVAIGAFHMAALRRSSV